MDYIGARYPRPLPSFLKSDQEDYKILIVQNSIVLPNSPFPKGGYRGITGIPKCRGVWPYALSPPRLGKPEELEKRCPSQKDLGLGGVPQSLNVIASGAKQSHRIPLYLQARGDCFVVLLYGRTPRNDIHITPRLGELEGVERSIPPFLKELQWDYRRGKPMCLPKVRALKSPALTNVNVPSQRLDTSTFL
jgi:hypothetical protein